MAGRLVCGKSGGCDAPAIPQLDPYSNEVYRFFIACSDADLWDRVPMGSQRRRLRREAIAIEAAARGLELSEHFLTKLAECERVVRAWDAKRPAAE